MSQQSVSYAPRGSLWEGASLIAGTAIGGGMLAIPLCTYQGGFWMAFLTSVVAWICLTGTGLALCRVLSVSPDRLSFLALAHRWLGKWWTPGISTLFMVLLWLLLIAYSAGGGALLRKEGWSPIVTTLCFVAPLSSSLIGGRSMISRLNSLLFGLLLFVGVLFGCMAAPHWSAAGLATSPQAGFVGWWAALPVLFAAFGFQNVLPTVSMHLGRDARRLSQAVLCGTSLAFLLIVGWQALVFGCLSPDNLRECALLGTPVTRMLGQNCSQEYLFAVAGFVFSYLAMATSFLGVAQAGLEVLRKGDDSNRRPILCLGLIASAWIASLLRADMFERALSMAGGLGVSILNGVLPVALLLVAVKRGAIGMSRTEQMVWGIFGIASLSPLIIELLGIS